MTLQNRRVLMQIAAVGGPLLLFFAAKVVFTPASVPANPVADAHPQPVATPPAPPELNDQQRRTLEWLSTLPIDKNLASPFRAEVAATEEPPPEATGEATPGQPVDPTANLRLTAVLGSSHGGAATINGRIYRPGDVVVPGVRLHSVDARGQRVELVLDDQRVVELRYEP